MIEGIVTLTHLLESNCAVVAPAPSPYAGEHPQLDMDPRRALLAFMASALPQSHPDFDAVLTDPEVFVDAIHMTPETHLVGEHASIAMALANVPGTVGDVKTRITWVQVPREDGTVQLELVHRVGGYEECRSLVLTWCSLKSRWSTTGTRRPSLPRSPTASLASSTGRAIPQCPSLAKVYFPFQVA